MLIWGRKSGLTVGEDSQSSEEEQQNSDMESQSQSHSVRKAMSMTSPHRWSVFDGVETTAPENPETLISEINSAISNLEFARATSILEPHSDFPSKKKKKSSDEISAVVARYDARIADEAFKAGCSALAAGELDEALRSLNVSLSKCPPEKASAVARLQSLISLTSQQLQRSETIERANS